LAPAVSSSEPIEAAWPDELHRIIDRHAGRHITAGGIDVEGDFLLRIFGFEEEKLGAGKCCHRVVDRTDQEDDPFAEQPREDVPAALAAIGLFDHLGDDRHGGFKGVSHIHPSQQAPETRRLPESSEIVTPYIECQHPELQAMQGLCRTVLPDSPLMPSKTAMDIP
jgi:hypothetical protein